jgi:succinate dehydrogenase / fumarate reductase iron-sulfur subunit
MRVALKIWRVGADGRALREYEVDAPEQATLLDVLDLVKDRCDGTLAYRKSCRMMICGSCGMRMDGAAVLACGVRMRDLVAAGRVPVISAMGNLPVVKDLVVDMEPFWAKYRAVNPHLQPAGGAAADGREPEVAPERLSAIHKESLCINCGACVSECDAMSSDPDFLGPQALAKAMRFVGDPRDGARRARLEAVNGKNGIWQCTRCYFCNERCPKGVDPRDAIAKLGAESIAEGIDRDPGARHARWFVRSAVTTGWLREAELVPRTQGLAASLRQVRFAARLARAGKLPPPLPPHAAERVVEARRLRDLLAGQGREGYRGIVQGERALGRIVRGHVEALDRDPYGPGSFPRPWLPGARAGAEEAEETAGGGR